MKNYCKCILLFAVIFGAFKPAFAGSDSNICVQSQLKELGYYTGKLNGKIDGATKAAGDSYIKYMTDNNPGWAQPKLTSSQAMLWCKQLAAAFPAKLSKYFVTSQGKGTGLVRVTGLSVVGSANTQNPYTVSVDFSQEGSFPTVLKSACFTWNGRNEVCVTPPKGISKSPFKAGLTTGRAGNYNLNVYIKYESGGKKLKSAESSAKLKVVK